MLFYLKHCTLSKCYRLFVNPCQGVQTPQETRCIINIITANQCGVLRPGRGFLSQSIVPYQPSDAIGGSVGCPARCKLRANATQDCVSELDTTYEEYVLYYCESIS